MVDSALSIEQVSTQSFYSLDHYPNILDRNSSNALWIMFHYQMSEQAELVFDFVRKDFVDLYLFAGDSLVQHGKTGFLLPASKKKMGRGNTIEVSLKPDVDYTIYCKIVNKVNPHDQIILVNERSIWREDSLLGTMKDVAFLCVILAFSVYFIFMFLQNRQKGFLLFALYLMSIFLFYSYITDILRDFFLKEAPDLPLYFLLFTILAAYFYLRFMGDFLDTKTLIPRWHKFYARLADINLGVLFVMSIYYHFTKDYYTLADITRGMLFVDVLLGTLLIYLLLQKRNTLVLYFVIGSALMIIGVMIDLIVWQSSNELGVVARIGMIVEIIFFALGLGKKSQLVEQEKETAQKSYIEQLKVNEQLIEGQKNELESQIKERTVDLIHAKEEAELNAKAKEEFMSVMSHEIRTPMNAIVGLTHILSTKGQDEENSENLTLLRYSVDSLMMLVNNVLDYNKISAGKIILEEIDFDLGKLVEGVAHLFKSKADSKGLRFELDIAENIPKSVNGDPFRLSQILNNFLSNAIKFTDTGGIDMSVTLQNVDDRCITVLFKITDTGIGISKENREGIFQSFSQAKIETSRVFGGTGLGLSISRNLLRLMQSEVILESEENKGSSFGFELKLKRSLNGEVTSVQSKYLSLFQQTQLSDLYVLIVDDNKVNRIILKKFMENWGVKSDMAEGGLMAMECMRENVYDIVLLDLQMPDMDGYAVAKAMRRDPRLQNIPVIAISADNISNVHDRVVQAGLDDFISKPFNPNELKSKIFMHTSRIKNIS